jgi:hypothetical protein
MATGLTLEAEFLYLLLAYGSLDNTELQAFGSGVSLGALTAAAVVIRSCRYRYTRSRAMNLALHELQREDEPLRKAYRRRDQLPVLLRLEARRLIRSLRFSGGGETHAEVFVLLGAARFLEDYSKSSRSLEADLPDEVRSVLENLAVVLSSSSKGDTAIKLGRRVGAFDDDGRPDPDLEQFRPKGFEDRIQRLQPTVRGLIPIVIFALLLAATLFAMLGVTSIDWPLP